MTGVTLELRGGDQALKTLGEVAARSARPKGLFDLVGSYLVFATQRRFETGTAPDGSPWPASIRARLTGGRTLVKSGRLLQSITHIPTDDGVQVGTNVLYAAIHQLGGVIAPVSAKALSFVIGDRRIFAQRVTIPARPFLGIDREDETEIAALAGEWLLQGGARAD